MSATGRRAAMRQSFDATVKPRGIVFYGWWIVAASAGVQFVIGMLFNHAQGYYVAALRDEFKWSATSISGALALSRIESGMLGPVEGWLLDRFGPQRVMIGGLMLMGSALIALSFVNSLPMFYVTYFLIALGATLGGFLSITVAIVNWFSRHRAKAMALAQLGFAAAGMGVPLTVWSMNTFGWDRTALASGVLIWLLGIPLALRIRNRPDTFGETPDGVPFDAAASALVAGSGGHGAPIRRAVAADGSEDFTAKQAMRTSAFWYISLGHASALLIVAAVMAHMIVHLKENIGWSGAALAAALPALTAMQVIGQISGGFLGDRYDKRVIATGCMALHTVGLLLLAYATNAFMVIGFFALHGWAWGARGPLMQAIRADYFGTASFGKIMGVSTMIVAVGSSMGPLIAGYFKDRYGNYEVGFTVLAVLALAGSAFFMLAKKPEPPARGEVVPVVPLEPLEVGVGAPAAGDATAGA